MAQTVAPSPGERVFKTEQYSVRAVSVVAGLYHPSGTAFLPDGRVIITERRGTMRIFDSGKLVEKPIEGIPQATEHGQGGLLDVALHPKYAENGWIYWTYNAGKPGEYGTELARGKLGGTRYAPAMTNVEVLFRMQPKSAAGHHFGSRIVFDRNGYLFIVLGDRGDSPSKGTAHRAQQLNDHAGKSIRLHDDGRVPADNPFVKTAGAKPEIFTIGNPNMQGAALHPETGLLWAHEHGPQGGDEINILLPGSNYGWPVVTYGANYGSGTKIGEGPAKDGMTLPLYYWVPSIAPSGMAFYTANNFPKWKGNLFVGALAGQSLARLTLNGDKVVAEERLFEGKLGRIRDVRQGPDGNLYLLTDAPKGELIRIEIAK
ncbi:MAG: PQQ-dependent sugar dehydrogenase [Burkholderiales bacterium]|nr:PQQ-dependent sugar dehydrogenase [Burkholderiales bacterium]